MSHRLPMEFTSDFFDASSAAWTANKIKKPNCTYVYKCSFVGIDKKPCCTPRHKETPTCWRHRGKKLASDPTPTTDSIVLTA
jgi:hypothetical protein